MSNMSYCRFQNTLQDLRDCRDALQESFDDLSNDEKNAALELISVCKDIADEHYVGEGDIEDDEE
jgi:hypothetical protein